MIRSHSTSSDTAWSLAPTYHYACRLTQSRNVLARDTYRQRQTRCYGPFFTSSRASAIRRVQNFLSNCCCAGVISTNFTGLISTITLMTLLVTGLDTFGLQSARLPAQCLGLPFYCVSQIQWQIRDRHVSVGRHSQDSATCLTIPDAEFDVCPTTGIVHTGCDRSFGGNHPRKEECIGS